MAEDMEMRTRGDPEVNGQLPPEQSDTRINDSLPLPKLKENWTFKRRQIQMMAICSSIGTALLYDSGQTLGVTGPVPLLLAYILMGSVVYAVLITLGEMISLLPLYGAVFSLPNRFWLPGIGFACAWCYTLGYALDIPDKAIAFSNYMAYWRPDDQPAIWITIFIIAPLLFNLLDVRRYGEIEFIFTTIKIYAIFGIIALGFIIIAGGTLTTPLLGTNNAAQPVPCGNNQTDPCLPLPGFKYWQDSSAFKPYFSQGAKGKVAGFWDCCTLAIFSYTENELVAITAWETEYPRYSLPKAVRRVSGRIVLYYTVAIFFLGLTVSSNDPLLQLPTNTNPRYHGGFIIMAERAGIPVVPHIINAVMILSVLTVVTIDIYVVSRCLAAMAHLGYMGRSSRIIPELLMRRNKRNVPWVGVLVCVIPWCLAYVCSDPSNTTAQNVFLLLLQMIGAFIVIPWAILCFTYLLFTRAIKGKNIPSVKEAESLFQPGLAIWGLFWSTTIVLLQGFELFAGINSIYWSQDALTWWVELGTVCVIAVFLLLLLLSRWVIGESAFSRKPLTRDQMLRGNSPQEKPKLGDEKSWKEVFSSILNGL